MAKIYTKNTWTDEVLSGTEYYKISKGAVTFTVTIASPAVFTCNGHALNVGDAIVFSTTGALPTGITAGTTYYVISAGLTINAFEIATTINGTAINTSGTQSGTHSLRQIFTNTSIDLSTSVVTAGSSVTAARMANIETGIDTLDDAMNTYTTGGTSTAYTLTTPQASALATLERWQVKFNATAGATPTLNRDAKGAKSLKYYDATGTKQSCGATTIIANMVTDVVYDGTDYVVMDILPTTPATTASNDFLVGNATAWIKKTLAETQTILNIPTFVARTVFSPLPTLEGTTTAGAGTYSVQIGEYSRIGDMCFFDINLTWSAHTGTGNMQINNLPITAANNGFNPPLAIFWNNITLLAVGNKILGSVTPNTKTIGLVEIGSAAGSAIPMDTAGALRLAGFYFV
jgi:hypothetical protein